MRMEGGQISGNIGAIVFDQMGTQENPKPTEVKRNKGSQDAEYWSDSANTRSSIENWEQMKGILSRLYLDENRSLGEVMDLMRSIYGFSAG
jgi:Clr5 domain